MLRKDRKDNEVEMEEKMKLISIREKEKEVAKKTIWELDKAMSLQQKHHLSSTETYKELLRSMEVKVSVAEEILNDSKVKCVQNEEKL